MKHSFLLIGQSNMGGRGFASEVEPIKKEKFLMLEDKNKVFLEKSSPDAAIRTDIENL